MKRGVFSLILAGVVAALSVAAPVSANVSGEHEVEIPMLQEGTYVEGEALVAMSATQAAALTKEGTVGFDANIQVEECWDFGEAEGADSGRMKDYVALVSSDTYTTRELMEIVSERYYVDHVAPNGYMHLCSSGTNDTMNAWQWYLDGTDALQTASSGIQYSQLSVTAKQQPVVALLDTGVDYTNPDLKDSMWVNPYQAQGLEGTYGYDFAEDDTDPMDTYGHGTHCAGVIAAQTNNNLGISGISNAKIMALKTSKDEEEMMSTANVVSALEYVVKAQELGVNIVAVNCSWGGGYDTGKVLNTLIDKVGRNGAMTIFAAGNDAVNWDTISARMRQTPYDLASDYVIVVGASNESDERAFFSDYGNSQVDLFAPGSNILSTVHEAKFLPQFWSQEKRNSMTVYYNSVSGLDGLYTASGIEGLETDYATSISYDDEVGFPDQSNGSIKYTVKYNRQTRFPFWPRAVQEGDTETAGFVYIDVTDLNMDKKATYYVSCLMAESEGDGDPIWESVEKVSTPDDSRFVTAGGRTYFAVVGISTTSTKSATCYLDDIAVSVADPDTSLFEKYDIMSGSSMAAPMVTGALAVWCAANPKLNILRARDFLMDSVRAVDAVENACISGGILDLSKVQIKASSLSLNKKNASVRWGSTLRLRATVSPSTVANAEVKWSSSNTKYATVTAQGVVTVKKAGIGKTVKITAKTKDGTGIKKTCKIKILAAKR